MKTLSTSQLADIIKRKREALHLSQNDLSKLTHINRSLISRMEQKDFVPSILQLESLGRALNFELDDVFINSNTPKLDSPSPLHIAVAGTGYVGLSIATLLAQHNHVTVTFFPIFVFWAITIPFNP